MAINTVKKKKKKLDVAEKLDRTLIVKQNQYVKNVYPAEAFTAFACKY